MKCCEKRPREASASRGSLQRIVRARGDVAPNTPRGAIRVTPASAGVSVARAERAPVSAGEAGVRVLREVIRPRITTPRRRQYNRNDPQRARPFSAVRGLRAVAVLSALCAVPLRAPRVTAVAVHYSCGSPPFPGHRPNDNPNENSVSPSTGSTVQSTLNSPSARRRPRFCSSDGSSSTPAAPIM